MDDEVSKKILLKTTCCNERSWRMNKIQLTMRKIAILLLSHFLPLKYIFYACPISDCVGSIFTLAMYLLILKKRLAVIIKGIIVNVNKIQFFQYVVN